VFAPGWAASLLTLALLPGLLSLGYWQLQRAAAKRNLMFQAQQGRQQLLDLNAANAAQLNRYQHVRVQGHYDNARQILLDNMPSNNAATAGQPGYRVLTPLQLDDAHWLLVARGWIALADRQQLPVITVDEQRRELSGLLDELPQPGVRAGNAGLNNTWPQRLNYPNATELQSLYGPGLLPRIVLLDADQADGYERLWPINLGFTPERHVAYAVQWFGLAATLLIIYVVVNLKRADSP
jgi:surfeit locus 1 family protein